MRMFSTRLLQVLGPEAFLDVGAGVGLAVDVDKAQGVRNDVAARLGKNHVGPGFPFAYGPADDHGPGSQSQDGGTHPLMSPYPRVDRQPVRSRPADERLHRGGRVAMFQGGSQRCDHMRETRGLRTLTERGENLSSQSPLRHIIADGSSHETESGWCNTRLVVLDGPHQGAVIAVGQILQGPVPTQGYAPATGDDPALIEYKDVVLREVLVRAFVVFRGDRVVEDELRPLHPKDLIGLRFEVGAVAAGHNLHACNLSVEAPPPHG